MLEVVLFERGADCYFAQTIGRTQAPFWAERHLIGLQGLAGKARKQEKEEQKAAGDSKQCVDFWEEVTPLA